MKFLTTPESTRLGIPAQVQASGVILLMGIIIMYWSFALNFVLGNTVRLMALFLGAILIGIAVLLRTGSRLSQYAMPLLVGVVYFGLLLLISKVQGHGDMTNPTLLPYTAVAFIMLLCGYLLGSERPFYSDASNRWIFVFCALACALNNLVIIRTLQSADVLARSTTVTRDSFNEFNPISVAFNTGCISAIFLGLAFVNRQFLKRLIYFVVFAVMLLLMLASASRGPALWMACTFLLALLMVRRHRYFDGRQRLYFFAIILIGLVVALIAYQASSAVSTRIDMLWTRYSHLLAALTEKTYAIDSSSSGRITIWTENLRNFREWLLMGLPNYSKYPHNFWLEILVRFGFLGIPLLLVSLYVMARLMIDIIRGTIPGDGEFAVIAILFLFAYLSNLTSLTLTSNRALFLGLGYFLGYYISLKKHRMAQPNRHRPPIRPRQNQQSAR